MDQLFKMPDKRCLPAQIYFWIAMILTVLGFVLSFLYHNFDSRAVIRRTISLIINILLIFVFTFLFRKLCENGLDWIAWILLILILLLNVGSVFY